MLTKKTYSNFVSAITLPWVDLIAYQFIQTVGKSLLE